MEIISVAYVSNFKFLSIRSYNGIWNFPNEHFIVLILILLLLLLLIYIHIFWLLLHTFPDFHLKLPIL